MEVNMFYHRIPLVRGFIQQQCAPEIDHDRNVRVPGEMIQVAKNSADDIIVLDPGVKGFYQECNVFARSDFFFQVEELRSEACSEISIRNIEIDFTDYQDRLIRL